MLLYYRLLNGRFQTKMQFIFGIVPFIPVLLEVIMKVSELEDY